MRPKLTMKTKFILLMLLLLPMLTMANETPGSQSKQMDLSFPECPDKPNCVSSLAKDPARKVDPFLLQGDPSSSMELLIEIINSSRRAIVISSTADRLVAEYRSLLGFVDDVIFVVSTDRNIIHVRSASRSGTWDLGVNRRRVERIRKQYLESGIQFPDH